MIAAFVTLEGKKERGVGKQNFQYAPGFKEFMLILRSHGRRVYEFVATHIPVMEDRSILYVVDIVAASCADPRTEGSLTNSVSQNFPWSFVPGHSIWFTITSQSWGTPDRLDCRAMIPSCRQPFSLIGTVMLDATSSWVALVNRFKCLMLNPSGS